MATVDEIKWDFVIPFGFYIVYLNLELATVIYLSDITWLASKQIEYLWL